MEITASQQTCSFCTQSLTSDHKCPNFPFFTLLNEITAEQRPDPISHIHNLVFQGGGVKGEAYLGVVKELGDEFLKNNVKRVAGTSAGALMSLALGLKFDIKEIEDLLSIPFRDLLDEDLVLKVNSSLWILSEYHNFKVKDIVLATLDYLKQIEQNFSPENQDQTLTEIKNFVIEILKYYTYKISRLGTAVAGTIGIYNPIANIIANFIIKNLGQKLKEKQSKIAAFRRSDSANRDIPNNLKPLVIEKPQDEGVESDMDVLLENVMNEAFNEVRIEQDEIILKKEEARKRAERILEAVRNGQPKIDENDLNILLSALQPHPLVSPLPRTGDSSILDFSFRNPPAHLTNLNPVKIPAAADKVLLNDSKHLTGGIAELLYFLINDQRDADNNPKSFGLFNAKLIQKKWIEYAIKKAFDKNHIKYDPNITFQEMMDLKLCRPFYVVAYNTALLRTEIFSYEHTPNVVVVDAVRSSMSIPVFFIPSIIREKINGKLIPREISVNNKPEIAYYLDGGLTDNFPIWMFDDLKYLIPDNALPDWNPHHRCVIRNPYTLGFKFLDAEKIATYLHPFVENVPKSLSNTEFSIKKSLSYFLESVIRGTFSEQENSQFIHRGDWIRTGYVDNREISAINFNLSEDEKKALVDSGYEAVRMYKKRAENNFQGEGEFYPGRFQKK